MILGTVLSIAFAFLFISFCLMGIKAFEKYINKNPQDIIIEQNELLIQEMRALRKVIEEKELDR